MSRVIGKFIKVRRAELGLSQNNLARSLGYNTSQYISNIERGLASIPFAKIQEMAALLKVDYRHLLNLKLMEEVPGFKQEFLMPKAAVEDGSKGSGLMSVPVMTPELCAGWTDLNDLDFPRKISNHFEYAHTRDEQAFFFRALVISSITMAGIRDGDLLLVEPSREVSRGSIVLSIRHREFSLGKILPRNGEVILQPLDPDRDLEIIRRQDLHVFPVAELKRRLGPP
ncbi:MAG: helix-turn-helix domain-containing protein [Acidobacteriota bacterium]